MPSLSRRGFLRQSFAFSAAALLAARGAGSAAPLAPARITPSPGGRHVFAVGDWGEDSSQGQQMRVAAAMQGYQAANRLRVENLLMLGDNWYGPLPGGVDSPRWQTQFEQMYPPAAFPGKAYAVLGNHDYEEKPASKVDAQLGYAARGRSRWTMPNHWYSFRLPETEPLVKVVALDTNYPVHGEGLFRTPTLNAEQVAQQNDWLRAQLAEAPGEPFTFVIGHHPIFSNGDHGDTPALIRDWDPLFRERRVHMYLNGHDHDLQHLEVGGSPVSYVVSGGGGATLHKMKVDMKERGPYGVKVAGFTHLELTRDRVVVRHISDGGELLHSFSKTAGGEVTI